MTAVNKECSQVAPKMTGPQRALTQRAPHCLQVSPSDSSDFVRGAEHIALQTEKQSSIMPHRNFYISYSK